MRKLLLCLSFIVLGALSQNTCGGNCPSGDCPQCICGEEVEELSLEQVCNWANWNQECCQCIVQSQSDGIVGALNYNEWDGTYDVGLWQINQLHWQGMNPPCTALENFLMAAQLYTEDGWQPWVGSCPCAG